MDGRQICPDHAPLPTAWNLPFHPVSGIQTSNLMSESGVGLIVAATRQKAGSRSYAAGGGPGSVNGFSGMNAPAATDAASVMVVFGSLSDARLSHDWAAVAVSSPLTAAAASVPATSSEVLTEELHWQVLHWQVGTDHVARPLSDVARSVARGRIVSLTRN